MHDADQGGVILKDRNQAYIQVTPEGMCSFLVAHNLQRYKLVLLMVTLHLKVCAVVMIKSLYSSLQSVCYV